MNLLDPTYIRDNVDYSFGDQSGSQLSTGYMKTANLSNTEFIKKYTEVKKSKNIMTLFIDNIRLYQRKNIRYTSLEMIDPIAKKFKDERIKELSDNDLLKLCSKLKDMNFVIFSSFEDTPIDEEIFDKIPQNVLSIYASNAIEYGGKVHPIPYGIQRKLSQIDNRHVILKNLLNDKTVPNKLLYINHNVRNNPIRQSINNQFNKFPWVTIETPMSISDNDYRKYLESILKHKFMICPDGNAIGCDCHRNWEVIYMRRVPIMIKNQYLQKIFQNIPVLFVDSFLDINEKLLIENDFLFEEMKNYKLEHLDIKTMLEKIINHHSL